MTKWGNKNEGKNPECYKKSGVFKEKKKTETNIGETNPYLSGHTHIEIQTQHIVVQSRAFVDMCDQYA